jgi:hypothetical protein
MNTGIQNPRTSVLGAVKMWTTTLTEPDHATLPNPPQ